MSWDYDFFYFPAYATKDLGTPVLGAGTLVGATNDNTSYAFRVQNSDSTDIFHVNNDFHQPPPQYALRTIEHSTLSVGQYPLVVS